MKRGGAALGALGLGLVVLGVVVALTSGPVGIAFVAIGLVAFVLAASDWAEFSAEVRDLVGFKVIRSAAVSRAAHEPEIKILSLEERGGHSGAIDFAAEIVNDGTRFCRAEIAATIDGVAIECRPATLDLSPNQPPQVVRILVPRPDLGDLVKAFNSDATLYGRTLTVAAVSGEHRAERQWSEHVYTVEENSERERIQQREWRIGRGEATDTDLQAEEREERIRRYIQKHGTPEP